MDNTNFDILQSPNLYHYPRLQRKRAEAMTLLQLVEYVVSETQGCQLASSALAHVRMALRVLSERMEITEMGAFFLCWILNNFHDRHLLIADLARQLDCSNITVLSYWAHVEQLRDKHYVCIGSFRNDMFLQVPNDVMKAMRENRVYQGPTYENLDEDMFLSRLTRLCSDLNSGMMTGAFFMDELDIMAEANKGLVSAGWLTATPNRPDMRGLMALTIGHHMMGDNRMDMSDIMPLFEHDEDAMRCHKLIIKGQHPMQLTDWIEPVCDNGQANAAVWCLTTKSQTIILKDATIDQLTNSKGLIQPEGIISKQLFFRPEMDSELKKLRNLLSQERLPEVQKRLEESGMRRGVTCIFYGGPGTGKTESALQLAKETGRAIMKVDISQMRDKYVGESEKQVKGIFDRYRSLCKTQKVMPILLFNEADALFTKRNTDATYGTDKMENAMQNIILEEMERLDGILIATTNLAQSMDSAFERRFLYKLEFQTPRPEESRHIWSEMVKDLSEEDAYSLAKEFRFSGGQIENIARKRIIASLLDDKPIQVDGLREFCRQEQFKKETRSPIGFC